MTGHTAVVFKSNFNVNTGGFGCPVTPNISKKIYKYNEGFDLIQNINVFSLKTTVFKNTHQIKITLVLTVLCLDIVLHKNYY